MPGLEDLRKKLGKGVQPPPAPKVITPRPIKPKVVKEEVEVDIFDKQEYTDLLTGVIQYLATYNNLKRQDKIKVDGIVYNRNKRMIKLKEKLKKKLNY